MMISFSKYSGCGNDFILIDNRNCFFQEGQLVQDLCHRHQGIGADGVILLEKSKQCDFRMRIFNSDGSEAEMCGNGIRCLMMFIQELGLNKPECKIETMHRQLFIQITDGKVVTHMGNALDIRWDLQLTIQSQLIEVHYLNTGVPHAVHFVDHVDRVNIAQIGPQIRHHPLFGEKGTNVNFVQLLDTQKIKIRTFERGVEAETQACGTGASAAALAAVIQKALQPPITVIFASGEEIIIDLIKHDTLPTEIIQIGPARCVYKGQFKLSQSQRLEFMNPYCEPKIGALCLQN